MLIWVPTRGPSGFRRRCPTPCRSRDSSPGRVLAPSSPHTRSLPSRPGRSVSTSPPPELLSRWRGGLGLSTRAAFLGTAPGRRPGRELGRDVACSGSLAANAALQVGGAWRALGTPCVHFPPK